MRVESFESLWNYLKFESCRRHEFPISSGATRKVLTATEIFEVEFRKFGSWESFRLHELFSPTNKQTFQIAILNFFLHFHFSPFWIRRREKTFVDFLKTLKTLPTEIFEKVCRELFWGSFVANIFKVGRIILIAPKIFQFCFSNSRLQSWNCRRKKIKINLLRDKFQLRHCETCESFETFRIYYTFSSKNFKYFVGGNWIFRNNFNLPERYRRLQTTATEQNNFPNLILRNFDCRRRAENFKLWNFLKLFSSSPQIFDRVQSRNFTNSNTFFAVSSWQFWVRLWFFFENLSSLK